MSDTPSRHEVTALLARARAGDEAARDDLAPLVYDALKGRAEALMRRERGAQSLQATILVADAYMRLVDAPIDWEGRSHFYALAAREMRRVLVEHCRARSRQKRGGDVVKVQLDEALTVSVTRDADILRIEDALERLAEIDPFHAEVVTMRFFAGMSMAEIAEATDRSKRSLEREWTLIKAWLRRELAP